MNARIAQVTSLATLTPAEVQALVGNPPANVALADYGTWYTTQITSIVTKTFSDIVQ